MPFHVEAYSDGTYQIKNAETGKVYAYATKKPLQVMTIVKRYAGRKSTKKRKSNKRKFARRKSTCRGGGQYGRASSSEDRNWVWQQNLDYLNQLLN